jgi:hypothetical protein
MLQEEATEIDYVNEAGTCWKPKLSHKAEKKQRKREHAM